MSEENESKQPIEAASELKGVVRPVDLAQLNAGMDLVREALRLPDDLPVLGSKEPEYAGGRAAVLRALRDAGLVKKDCAEAWFRTYAG